jgi:drug/metabolite transporter (DMT)-like permease
MRKSANRPKPGVRARSTTQSGKRRASGLVNLNRQVPSQPLAQPLAQPSAIVGGGQPWLAYGLLALAALCWAGNHVVGRFVAGSVPPGGLAVLRWLITVLVLWPFAAPYIRRDWPALRAGWRPLVLLALAGGGIFGTLQFVALAMTSALNVAVFNSVVPVCILIANLLIFAERVSGRQGLGIFVSLGGVLVIIAKGDAGRLASLNFNAGDLLVIANMLLFGIYSACLRLKPNIHWLTFTVALAVVSGLANVPVAIWETVNGQILQPTLLTLWSVLYVGVLSSALAYAAWSVGVGIIGSARAGAFLHLIPLYGAILSTLFLGEQIQPFHVGGLVAILAGVTLAAGARAPRPARVTPTPASGIKSALSKPGPALVPQLRQVSR